MLAAQAQNAEKLLAQQLRGGRFQQFRQGNISGRELQQYLKNLRSAETRTDSFTNKEGFAGVREAFTTGFSYNRTDFFDDLQDSAMETADVMKSSFKDAFGSLINGSKSVEEAFRDLSLNILNKITDRTLGVIVDSLFSALMSGIGKGRASGGLVGYAGGGAVRGGSGVIDDVPAMLSKGEYVIKKSSVNKYGEDFLNLLNSSGVNYTGQNEFVYDHPRRPKGGVISADPNLSNFALTDENNPQNMLRMERESNLYSYLREKVLYDRQKKAAIKAANDAKRNILIQSYISAASSIGSVYMGNAFGGGKGVSGGIDYNSSYYGGFAGQVKTGGSLTPYGIRRYSGGGSVDDVPALLTAGEYVMSRSAVQRHGPAFFDMVNRGQLRGYNSGGLVGGTSYAPNDTRMSDLILKLSDLTEILKNGNNNKTATMVNPVTQQVAPSINVTVNVTTNRDGSTKEDTQTSTRGQVNQTEEEKARNLAETIRAVVIKEMVTQKRANGLLDAR